MSTTNETAAVPPAGSQGDDAEKRSNPLREAICAASAVAGNEREATSVHAACGPPPTGQLEDKIDFEQYLGFGISAREVKDFWTGTFEIEPDPSEAPIELWISCFGNHSDNANTKFFCSKWIRDVQLAGPKPEIRDNAHPDTEHHPNPRKYQLVEATWRDINDDDEQINPLRYFQSADVVVVAMDAKEVSWMQRCKLWLKEAVDSNVGNLRGVIFLVGSVGATDKELNELLKKLEETRYQLQFQGAVFVQKVQLQLQGNSDNDNSTVCLFQMPSFVSAVQTGVAYILECHAQLLWEPQVEFFDEWIACQFGERHLPQILLKSGNERKTIKHKVLQASESFCLEDTHKSESKLLADEYGKISTSVWDIAHLERLTFQSSLLVEAFFYTIVPLYLVSFIEDTIKWIRRVAKRRCKESSSAKNRQKPKGRDFEDKTPDEVLQTTNKRNNNCWMGIRSAAKMRHVRSFWGSGKWLYARSPLMAMKKQTSSGYPVGYNWSLKYGQISCVVSLLLVHSLCALLFVFSSIKMGFLDHIEDGNTRLQFEITAHHYFAHYIGLCILYSVWTFVVIVPSQTTGVRQVTLLGTPRESDRITNLIQSLKRLAKKVTKDATPDMNRIMEELQINVARTTENLEIVIKKKVYRTVSNRWKVQCAIAGFIACGLRIAVSYVTTVIEHTDFKDVTLFDRIQFHTLRCGSGFLLGLGIYMILYTAGGTAKMCLETMALVTELLAFDESDLYHPPQMTSCCESMKFCRCTRNGCKMPSCMSCSYCCKQSNTNQDTLPRYLVPFLPLNAYGWLYMRQNLFNQTHANFVEASSTLLVPVVLILFSAGHILTVLFRKEDIFLRIGVLFDTVLASLALLYVAYEASSLQDVQNRQLRLLSNHLTSVQQLHDQLERESETNTKYMQKIRTLLKQSCTALGIVRATVRDNYLSMVVWPGITLSKDLVTTLIIALGTLGSTFFNYWSAQ